MPLFRFVHADDMGERDRGGTAHQHCFCKVVSAALICHVKVSQLALLDTCFYAPFVFLLYQELDLGPKLVHNP